MKICCKFTLPQAIQDVDELVSSSEQIWRNLALHHLLTNRSFRMWVQTTTTEGEYIFIKFSFLGELLL